MNAVDIRVRLKEYLEANNLSAYRLAQHIKGVSEQSVYAYAAGRKEPSLEALGKIASALQGLTQKPVALEDLLEFVPVPDPETAAWLEAGADDVAGRIAKIEGELPPEQVKAWFEAQAKAVKPARYVPGKGLVVEEV